MNKKSEVIKHSSAIQISNKITLLQRKIYNVLLANAYDDLPRKDVYEIEVSKLCSILGFGRNTTHLKEALEALLATSVKWNILERDKNQIWGAAALLSQVKIESGVCSYAYPPWMRQQLYNPKIYARINLSLQNQFNSKHSLALYELCLDYYRDDQKIGETPWISLDNIRLIFDLKDETYSEFKFLNSFVIKKAIIEVNQTTDLYIEEPERKKSGKKVTGLKFIIKSNSKIDRKNDVTLPIKKIEFEKSNNKIMKRLVDDFNLSENVAKKIFDSRDENWIEYHLSEIDKKVKAGNIDKTKIGGYTATVLKNAVYTDHEIKKDNDESFNETKRIHLTKGLKVKLGNKIYSVDEGGFVVLENNKGVIPPGDIRMLINSGKMSIVDINSDSAKS